MYWQAVCAYVSASGRRGGLLSLFFHPAFMFYGERSHAHLVKCPMPLKSSCVAVPHWLSMHVKGRGMGKWAGLPDGGGGWSDRSAVPCSGRRESEREGAEKQQKGCVRRSHVGGVESCETARSPEVSVRLRWKIFWMCRCIRSSNGAAGVPGLCWRHRVEPDKQAVSETSRRSDGPDVVMFG